MCTLLKELLEGHLKVDDEHCDYCDNHCDDDGDDSQGSNTFLFEGVREHIDDVRDRENEIGGDYDLGSDSDEGFDVNNSTHTTKVILSQKSQVQNKI